MGAVSVNKKNKECSLSSWNTAEGKTTLCLQRILLSINKSEG